MTDPTELARTYADLDDPSDPYPAELVGQLARAVLALTTERDEARDRLRVVEEQNDALGDANEAHVRREQAERERDEALRARDECRDAWMKRAEELLAERDAAKVNMFEAERQQRIAEAERDEARRERDRLLATVEDWKVIEAERDALKAECERLRETVQGYREGRYVSEVAERKIYLDAHDFEDALRSQLAAVRAALREACDGWEGLWTSDYNDPPPDEIAELRKQAGDK